MEQFDPNIPGLIGGDVTAVIVTEQPAIGLANHVVNGANPFTVQVDWNLNGVLAPLWLAGLGGNWDVSVYAESLGGGQEIRLGSDNSIPAVFSQLSYSSTITVPPTTLDEHVPGTDTGGIYKLVAAVFLNSNLGGPFDVIGFSEGPIIQVENPV